MCAMEFTQPPALGAVFVALWLESLPSASKAKQIPRNKRQPTCAAVSDSPRGNSSPLRALIGFVSTTGKVMQTVVSSDPKLPVNPIISFSLLFDLRLSRFRPGPRTRQKSFAFLLVDVWNWNEPNDVEQEEERKKHSRENNCGEDRPFAVISKEASRRCVMLNDGEKVSRSDEEAFGGKSKRREKSNIFWLKSFGPYLLGNPFHDPIPPRDQRQKKTFSPSLCLVKHPLPVAVVLVALVESQLIKYWHNRQNLRLEQLPR